MLQVTKDYKTLKKEWYKKLKDSGFTDIEYEGGHIKAPVFRSSRAKTLTLAKIEAIQAYYLMATHFLNDHNFATETDRIVWLYHSEGLSIRKIYDTLKKANQKVGNNRIRDIIKRLRTEMKARYLQP